jgi:ribosomal protein S18 acetylase RimI-like enzyme
MAVMIREARIVDAAGIARVHVESWRTTYRGIVPAAYLDALSVENRQRGWERQLAAAADTIDVFVAEEVPSGEIVGFVSGGPEQTGTEAAFPWELHAIYLLADRQRRGVGRRLTAALVERLRQRGAASLLLWVLKQNLPARHFYEALGGSVVRERTITIGGLELAELAYAWRDLAALAGRCRGT